MTTIEPITTPDIAPPVGADFADIWETGSSGVASRVISSPNCGVTDHELVLWCDAEQRVDGALANPLCRIDINWSDQGMNSDQCRELASLLLESAALIDGWVR